MNDAVSGSVRIQLLHVPDCPLLDRVRRVLADCLRQAEIAVEVEELEGAYPSPTLVINGIDVTTGSPPNAMACCRLDLPTRPQVLSALGASRAP